MSKTKPFRERLAFDVEAGEVRDGEVRYLLIRPDTLMGLFAGLPAALRGQALDALARSTTEHGAKSARRYQALGAAEAEQLLATIEATAPQLGWGVWSLTPGADGALDLEVRNSPFAAGFGAADEVACAAMGAPSCRFEARPKQDT